MIILIQATVLALEACSYVYWASLILGNEEHVWFSKKLFDIYGRAGNGASCPKEESSAKKTIEHIQEYFYTAEAPPLKGNISWALTFPDVPLTVSNIGMGPAFNVHCVLHGYEDIYDYQFISWNNGPIGAGKDEIIHLCHPRHREFWLDRNDSVDGEHTLHYPSTRQSNPNQALACLTMTYQDLSDNKFVSIFDYTPYHEWVRVAISTPSSPKIALDLKELNDRKKQKNP